MEYLETKIVPLSELARFPGNARKHADAQLEESVKEGQYKSLLVRRLPDGQLVIVAGNGTADALEKTGATHARVEVWEYTDREAVKVNVKDNRLSDLASDDSTALAALIGQLDGDLAGTGWTEESYAKLTAEEPLPEPGDADTDELGNRYGVIIECTTEDDQVVLLGELGDRGLNVRAIVT